VWDFTLQTAPTGKTSLRSLRMELVRRIERFPLWASSSAQTWQGRLLAHLERRKRYPAEARARRLQGVAHVRFTMDRQGRVLSAALEHSSGHAALDREALALLQRAQPLPPPPAETPGERITLTVPVEFFTRGR